LMNRRTRHHPPKPPARACAGSSRNSAPQLRRLRRSRISSEVDADLRARRLRCRRSPARRRTRSCGRPPSMPPAFRGPRPDRRTEHLRPRGDVSTRPARDRARSSHGILRSAPRRTSPDRHWTPGRSRSADRSGADPPQSGRRTLRLGRSAREPSAGDGRSRGHRSGICGRRSNAYTVTTAPGLHGTGLTWAGRVA